MGNDHAAVEAASLLFLCLPKDALYAVRQGGLSVDGLPLYGRLAEARRARRKGERVLVARAEALRAGCLPPEAFANLVPYRKPRRVRAAGGLVVRPGAGGEAEVLLIFRRGAWDLPKGKRDAGESTAACALREVREEVGVRRLALLAEAGATLHGYPEGDRYAVKDTRWYFMATPERSFRPEAAEGIEAVAWAPWAEAEGRLGYDTLRALLARLGPEAARAALPPPDSLLLGGRP